MRLNQILDRFRSNRCPENLTLRLDYPQSEENCFVRSIVFFNDDVIAESEKERWFGWIGRRLKLFKSQLALGDRRWRSIIFSIPPEQANQIGEEFRDKALTLWNQNTREARSESEYLMLLAIPLLHKGGSGTLAPENVRIVNKLLDYSDLVASK